MSYVDTVQGTLTANPSGYVSASSYAYLNDASNAYTSEDSDTYAAIGIRTGSSITTNAYFKFDCSSIPADATIVSVACSAKGYIQTSTSSRIASRTMQMFTNTTAKGSGAQLTTTPTIRTLTVGTWTRSELTNARIRFYAKRGTSNVDTDYQMRFYGATLTVEYTYDGTFYTITTSSTATSATIAPATQDVLAGGSGTVTISGDITGVTVEDNGSDVTSALVQSGNDWTYTITSIAADHAITVADAIVATVPFRVKQSGAWVTPTKVLAKSGGTWHEIVNVRHKSSGSWS